LDDDDDDDNNDETFEHRVRKEVDKKINKTVKQSSGPSPYKIYSLVGVIPGIADAFIDIILT
jgi:hypothetical protein